MIAKLVKINQSLELEIERRWRSTYDYLYNLVDIYSATSVDPKFWLTDREKQFLVASLLVSYESISNYKSAPAQRIYEKHFNLKRKNDINDYVRKLEDKGWVVVVDKKQLVFPEVFSGLNFDEGKHNAEISVSLKLNDEHD